MSLIEEAAKRLEQLKRAGATTAGATRSAEPTGSDEVPLPEALVRNIETHREPRVDPTPASPRASPEPPGRPAAEGSGPAVRPPTRPVTGPRSVKVDLERLKTRGFVTPDAPTTQIADEFRVIKRPIIRNAVGRAGVNIRHGNLVMVTSSLPSEGKTFTALNLAMSIAMEYDNTALLVDGDVAHPGMPRLLGIPEAPGLLDLLTDDTLDVGDALVKTNIDKLTVLPAGTAHRRATELLASEQMVALLGELASRYPDRIIIFDSPPLLATTEARVLASHMGQIIMVVAADSTSQNALTQALATIESCEVVLMLLNKASRTETGTYSYYGADGSGD